MIVTIIGIGLMGGCMAIDIRKEKLSTKIIGVDQNISNLDKALALGIIDEPMGRVNAVRQSDLIILAIPVDVAKVSLVEILDIIPPHAIVMDLGSSKQGICQTSESHKNRSQYVACHPIAGTEFSGPSAAHQGLFDQKVMIICNQEQSSKSSLVKVSKLFTTLNMTIIHMDAEEHDRHIAFVSHLSHVTSFTLGLTVLDIEKNEKNIFHMAGSGFESTVRLANSSPEMWGPIFRQNANNLLLALDAYMKKLSEFRQVIAEKKQGMVEALMKEGNEIKRILDGIELKDKENTIPTEASSAQAKT